MRIAADGNQADAPKDGDIALTTQLGNVRIRHMTLSEAKESAHQVSAYLKARHGASKVVLFGSTVDGTFYPGHSDIDLYFEGVPYEKEFQAVGATLCEFPCLSLDLVPAGHSTAVFRQMIEISGVSV